MKAIVIKRLNRRVGAPSVNAKKLEPLEEGASIEIIETVKGDKIDGNNTWYKISEGCYVWSGGVNDTRPDENTTANWLSKLKIHDIWETYKETGASAKVAILDTGYDVMNPDINDAVSETCLCCETTVGIVDKTGHGTHCASIIGSRNKRNIVGCAPNSTLYIGKVSEYGTINYSQLVKGINWAISKNVDLISVSIGGEEQNTELESVVKHAYDNNITVVASIGNYIQFGINRGEYPALYLPCIAVGSVNYAGQLSGVSVLNPKTEIYTYGERIDAYSSDGKIVSRSGTSQSTAIISGILALVISACKTSGKDHSPKRVKELLAQHSDPVVNAQNQRMINPVKLFSNL